MSTIGCDKALPLLEQGWDGGLEEDGFRQVVTHVAQCPGCAAKVRSWSRVDSALGGLATALDRVAAPPGIPARVIETLARTRGAVVPDGRPVDELELTRFLKRLGTDSILREQVVRVGGPAARLDVLVTLAREHGFRFSEATVRQALMEQQAANDGELSDAQLEAVAGGAHSGVSLLRELLGELPVGGRS